jgi:hypothetical protein
MSSLFTLPTYTPPAEALTGHQPVERSSHLIAHTGESSRSVRPLQQVILLNGRKNGSEHRWGRQKQAVQQRAIPPVDS